MQGPPAICTKNQGSHCACKGRALPSTQCTILKTVFTTLIILTMKTSWLICMYDHHSHSYTGTNYEEIQARHYYEIREFFEMQQANKKINEEARITPAVHSSHRLFRQLSGSYFDKTVIYFSGRSLLYWSGIYQYYSRKADGAGNVVRVKAALRNLKKRPHVRITEEGSFIRLI